MHQVHCEGEWSKPASVLCESIGDLFRCYFGMIDYQVTVTEFEQAVVPSSQTL